MADNSPTTPKASAFRLNVQNEPSSSQPDVLEATAAPGNRGFARPGRRGASGGRRGDSGERRAGGASPFLSAAAASAGGVMSPLLSPSGGGAGGGERTPRATSPTSGTGTTGSRGSSPLTLSSRSQSMLRPPHPYPFDEGDLPGTVIEGAEEGLVDTEVYARMFTEMQARHDGERKVLEEAVASLEGRLRSLMDTVTDKDRYIDWADTRVLELQRQAESLDKENKILTRQARANERQVRDLETEMKRKETETRVFIRDHDGEEPISPGTANERFRLLREEIRELREERYMQNEEMEVLFEKKEKYEELQEEHQKIKEEMKVLERELEEVHQAMATPRVEQKPLVDMALKRASSMASTGVGGRVESLSPEQSPEQGIMRTDTELQDIAMLGHLIGEKDEQISRLGQRIQDKDDHIAKLESSIAGKDEQITRLKVESRKVQDRNAAILDEVAQKKESYDRGLERARQEYLALEKKLEAREKAMAEEQERHEAVESRLESDKRDLLARFKELEEGDQGEVENLEREVREKEAEIAKLKQDKQELEQKREELSEQNRHLQQTARTVRKWLWDQPILQTIANTQLWSEKNILKNSLDSIKNRVKRIEPEQLEQAVQLIGAAKQSVENLPGDDADDKTREARQALVQQLGDVQKVLDTRVKPLRAITWEVNQAKDRLQKEKEDWAKEDAEINAVLRRIEGRGGARDRRSRRQSENFPAQTDFMRRIEKFEEEQHAYITTKHDEYAAIQTERPLGAPLTPEEDKRLHDMAREFIRRLPDNPMVAFLSGETPQARRRSQLWALTEKVKRLKIRDKGQDIHTWLPRLKPSTMEHKRKHALLVKELHTLEEQVEDLAQKINDLTAPPDLEDESRGRPPHSRDDASISAQSKKQSPPILDPEAIRKREEDLRKQEETLRREIRFAHARLEKLLYNRQLFEHWTENLEKRLNGEAAALVTQVLLEFELQTVLDKESKEACFCSLLEYFLPRVYDFTVRGGQGSKQLGVGRHGHGREHGFSAKRLGVVAEEEGQIPTQPLSGKRLDVPKTAMPLGLGRSETLDPSGNFPGAAAAGRLGLRRRWSRKGGVTPTAVTPGRADLTAEEEEEEEIKRSRAPESLRAQDDPGAGRLPRSSTIYGEGGGGVPSTAHPFKGDKTKRRSVTFEDPDKEKDGRRDGGDARQEDHHGHGGGHLSILPTAQFLREHAYPIFCQVMTALIWFVLLLAIQPVNMFRTFSFFLSFAVGLPFYLLQATRFFLVTRRMSKLDRTKRADDKGGEKVVKDKWQRPTKGVDAFTGTSLGGRGLGIMLPAEPPHVTAGEAGEASSSNVVVGGPESEPGREPLPPSGIRGGAGHPSESGMSRGFRVPDDSDSDSDSDRAEPEDEERLRTTSPAIGELDRFITVSKKIKAKDYVVSDDEDDEEPAYGSKRRPTELHELQRPRPTPETSPQRSRPTESGSSKGKEKEEVLQPGCGGGGPGQQPEETGQTSRGRDPGQEQSGGQASDTQRSRDGSLSDWDRERMLANAQARIREEEQAKQDKIARRKQWWWWRAWYSVRDVLVSIWQSISAKWPSSWWHKPKPAQGSTEPPRSTLSRAGSPSWWDWRSRRSSPAKPASTGDVPDVTEAEKKKDTKRSFWKIEPWKEGQPDSPQSEKKGNTEPPFWSQWLASLRSFFDTFVVQKIPILAVTVRSFLQSGLTKLKSLLTRLPDPAKQLFSSVSTSLDSIFKQLLDLLKRVNSSITPSQALQSIRNKVPEIHVPRQKLRTVNIPRPNLNFHVPKLPSVSRLPKPNLNLPTLPPLPNLPRLPTLPSLPDLPKISPPRPPSPPTILGTLLSLFVIYTLLTYLAVVQERRVWTSADTTWRHAYLRDLELSRVPAVQVSPVSQQQHKLGNAISSLFSGSPSLAARSQQVSYVNTAYPGWSPLSADYRLVYAPLWYRVAYLPGDLASYLSHHSRQTFSWASLKSQQVWAWTSSTIQQTSFWISRLPKKIQASTPKSFQEAAHLSSNLWAEIKAIFVSRIIQVDRIGAVEIPSKISLLAVYLTSTIKSTWKTARNLPTKSSDLFQQVFLGRTIHVPGPLGQVQVPSLATLYQKKLWYFFKETVLDSLFGWVGIYISGCFTWFISPVYCTWELMTLSWELLTHLVGITSEFILTWGSKIPGVGYLQRALTPLSFWARWTWEVVKGLLLWGISGPVAVFDWASDVAVKFEIFGRVMARRYLWSWGAWFDGLWGEAQGYVLKLGEVIGLR